MNQPPFPPPPQGGPYREGGPTPPRPQPGWMAPAFIIAGLGNVPWLVGAVWLVSQVGHGSNGAMLAIGLVVHAFFTAVFALALRSARPDWSTAKLVAFGSFLASGFGGAVGTLLAVVGVGLLAAACGGCRR